MHYFLLRECFPSNQALCLEHSPCPNIHMANWYTSSVSQLTVVPLGNLTPHHHHSPTHSEKAMYIVFYIPSILYLTIAAIIILLWVPLYLSLSPTRTQRLWSRPQDPYLLLIILLYDFHPLILGLWLLINGIWQMWWDVTPMTRFHYIKLCLTSRLTSETLFGSFEESSLDMNSANHLSELGHLIIASILQLEIWG